jgi:phosphonate transport system permease protein
MSTLGAVLRGPTPVAPPHATRPGRSLAITLLFAVALGLAARVVELRPLELLRDAGNIAAFLRGYLHPSFVHIGEYAWQCVVTLCIALWGTVLAVAIPLPAAGAPLLKSATSPAGTTLKSVAV